MTPKNSAIYTKPGCPFCTKIKQVFTLKGWSFREYVLDVNFTREQFYSEFGHGSTFPQVIIDGDKTGGCNETVSYLKKRGLI